MDFVVVRLIECYVESKCLVWYLLGSLSASSSNSRDIYILIQSLNGPVKIWDRLLMSTKNWSIQYCRSSQTTQTINHAIRLRPRRNSHRSSCVDCGDWSKHRQNRSWVADKEPHHGAESTRTLTKYTVGSLVAETELSGGKIQGQCLQQPYPVVHGGTNG